MDDIISQTKAEYLRTKDRLIKVLSVTPDDKINWSPTPTSRTPIQVAAHCADAIHLVVDNILKERPFPFSGFSEFDASMRAAELPFTTREQTLELLEKNSHEFFAFIDGLTPEALGTTVKSFLGELPMTVAIGIPTEHTRAHIAQIEYLQTIWGDRDWHMTPPAA